MAILGKMRLSGVVAPALGTDDNYVTDAEKAALHTQNTDTALGTQTEILDMGGYKIQNLADATIGSDAVNLHQVLEIVPSERKFYLGDTASALANYKKLVETAETTPRTITVTITASDQNIRSAVGDVGWITDATVPNVTTLRAGSYVLHFYAKQTTLAGNKGVTLYSKMWNVDADGTTNLNLLGISSATRLLSATTSDYNVEIHLATPVTIDATDRIIIKVYATLSGSGTNPEIVFGYGDSATTDSNQAFPVDSADLQDLISKKHTQNTDTGLGTLSTKNPPIDADKTIYRDSTASDGLVTSTWTQIKAFLKTYFDGLYQIKVGDLYLSTDTTAPATKLGYGTWSAFGAGRVLVGLDIADADFNTAEKIGGAKTVAAAGSNAAEATHTHSVTSNVAIGSEAAHTHSVTSNVTVGDHGMHDVEQYVLTPQMVVADGDNAHNVTNNAVTSGVGSSHTHTPTNNAVTSAAGSSHNHAFTGSATSVVQPYIVVYMFKRTA